MIRDHDHLQAVAEGEAGGAAEKANVEMKTATSEAAKRCDDIMTYLARIPQKWLALLQPEFAQMLETTRTNLSG